MTNPLPTVSFIICTFNSQSTINECLHSIQLLDYPKDLIDAIVIDGGSKDNTMDIIKKYSFVTTHVIKTNGPEEATAIGYNMSTADYLVNFPSDNIITHPQWLKRMVAPLESDRTILAAETLRYTYKKNDKPLNKYFALFGMNDPVAFYLSKCDRASYLQDSWHLPVEAEDKGDYYKTTFTEANLPTVGANGFVVRRAVMQQATKDPKKFFHIDTCVDLLRNGQATYAFVKNDIWHKTGEGFMNFIKKRKRYATILYFNQRNIRRYHLYNPKTDTLNLIKYVIYSLTIIEPLILSVRGFIKIKDPAWFMHPIISFALTWIYMYTVISLQFQKFVHKLNK